MGSVPSSGTHVCTMIYISYMCATGRLYILLMTPQLEVLKHLGLANFDDNRSAELKRFYHLSLFGMMFK